MYYVIKLTAELAGNKFSIFRDNSPKQYIGPARYRELYVRSVSLQVGIHVQC